MAINGSITAKVNFIQILINLSINNRIEEIKHNYRERERVKMAVKSCYLILFDVGSFKDPVELVRFADDFI